MVSGNVGTIKWVGECSLLVYFLEEFLENWYYFSYKLSVEFIGEAIWAWIFLYGKISTLSISIIDVRLFRLSTSSWVSFGTWGFQKSHPFISVIKCPGSAVHATYALPFQVGTIGNNVPSFILNTVNLCLLFLTLTRDLLVLLIFLKELALDSRIVSIAFLFSISSISVLTFITPSLCLPWLQFALLLKEA